jgi:hypothetical protein
MPEPVLTNGFLAGYTALYGATRSESAVSSEARAVQKSVIELVDTAERSHALFGEKAAAISQIWALANECEDGGWDGESAQPISPLAANLAAAFIRALPAGLPLPEFAPEPDGSISVDWIQSRNRLFSLSVGQNSRLAYAWLDGTDRGHAVARFDGQFVPRRVLDGICGIMDYGHSAIRAA